jgi:hypothetical protein
LSSGADDFINKPFRAQDRLRRVEKVLEEDWLRHESEPDDALLDFGRPRRSLLPSSLCQPLGHQAAAADESSATPGTNMVSATCCIADFAIGGTLEGWWGQRIGKPATPACAEHGAAGRRQTCKSALRLCPWP